MHLFSSMVASLTVDIALRLRHLSISVSGWATRPHDSKNVTTTRRIRNYVQSSTSSPTPTIVAVNSTHHGELTTFRTSRTHLGRKRKRPCSLRYKRDPSVVCLTKKSNKTKRNRRLERNSHALDRGERTRPKTPGPLPASASLFCLSPRGGTTKKNVIVLRLRESRRG